MIGWAALSLALPVATGWLVLGAVWPRERVGRWDGWVKGWLAIGLGLGITSCSFFVASLLLAPARPMALGTDLGVLVIALVAFAARPRGAGSGTRGERGPAGPDTGVGSRLLKLAVSLAALSGAATFIVRSWARQHGEWDAWAVWNLRALFMVRGGDHWQDAFSPMLAWSHPDYPLLLPGLVARFWIYVGKETPVVPAGLAFFFTFGTVGLAWAAVATLRGSNQGFLAALVLLGTPVLIVHGTSQYADVPLGFFMLATFALFALSARLAEGSPGLTWLTGLMLGLSTWTKNEGLLFASVVLLARLGLIAPRNGWPAYRRELALLALGLAPTSLMVWYVKARLAPAGGYLWPQGFEWPIGRLAELARYGEIARAFAGQAATFGGGIVSVVGVLALYWLCLGARIREEDRATVAAGAAAFGLTVIGYVAVFLISPYPLTWQLHFAYHAAFTGGVRVAACDFDGDGRAEIVAAPGPGGGPHIRVFKVDPSQAAPLAELASFFAYALAFAGGVYVACGDLDGDGVPEVVTGAGQGGGLHVRAFRYASPGVIPAGVDFFAYAPAFLGGVRVAVGNADGFGRLAIITGAGPGGGPHVQAFHVQAGAPGGVVATAVNFFAYVPAFTGGVFVAAVPNGGPGLVTGADAGGGPHVRFWTLSGGVLVEPAGFFAYDPGFTGGVRVAMAPGLIVTGPGAGGGPHGQGILDGRRRRRHKLLRLLAQVGAGRLVEADAVGRRPLQLSQEPLAAMVRSPRQVLSYRRPADRDDDVPQDGRAVPAGAGRARDVACSR